MVTLLGTKARLGPSKAWTVSDGAKCSISCFHWFTIDFGTMISVFWPGLPRMVAMTCTVFPRPISSLRMPPLTPVAVSRLNIHLTPSC